jgi:hypothetical protein
MNSDNNTTIFIENNNEQMNIILNRNITENLTISKTISMKNHAKTLL